MEIFLWYILINLFLLIIVYLFDFTIKSKRNTLGLQKSFQYIVKKYDLKMNKERVRTLSKIICFVNSFILSIPITLVIFLNIGYIKSLIISFVIFVGLIIGLYNIVGIILKKKGW